MGVPPKKRLFYAGVRAVEEEWCCFIDSPNPSKLNFQRDRILKTAVTIWALPQGLEEPTGWPLTLAFAVASVGFLFTPLPRFAKHFVASTQESRVHFLKCAAQ